MGLTLFISFAFLVLLSVPISISLGFASVIALLLYGQGSTIIVIQKLFGGTNSFILMAIPFFILAGNIMSAGGVSRRLVNLADTILGRAIGGLAIVSTVSCTFFGAISGSAIATTTAIGSIMIEPMQKMGYSKDFSSATIAASGTIGLLIPPSITMVLYGVIADVSIAKLFLGGVIPGLLMCMGLVFVEYIISKRRGYRGRAVAGANSIIQAFKQSILALLMPVIILGGIYGGIFTPTEAAVVAVVYGLFIGGFVYRELRLKDLQQIIIKTVKSVAVVIYLVATARIFSHLLVIEEMPQKFGQFLIGISSSSTMVLFLICVCLLIVGTFLNNSVAIVLMTPIFYPIISQLGIDPVFFGVLMVLALAIGNVTPPVGLCLFAACEIADISIERVSKAVIPHIIVLIFVLFIILLLPKLVLLIPNTMM